MSVDFSSKHRYAIQRLPLSNITNIYQSSINATSKSQHPPLYSFRDRDNNLKPNIKSKTNLKIKSIECSRIQNKTTKLSKQAKQTKQNKPPKKTSTNLKQTIDQLRNQVVLLHSKSQTIQKLHKNLTHQVKQLQDNCKVNKFMKDQTKKKIKVLDSLTNQNAKALKLMMKESRKNVKSNRSTN